MKFDDSDKDYFLHNFDGDDSSSRQPSDAPSRPQSVSSDTGERNSPSFNFGETPQTRPSVKPRKRRHGWLWFFLIIAVLLGVTVYVRYFVPYVTESRTSGYVTLVEKRGIVFPTFEGEMVSESLLNDTSRVEYGTCRLYPRTLTAYSPPLFFIKIHSQQRKIRNFELQNHTSRRFP